MNVFILSPGRTATTTIAEALKNIDGYTAAHESRVGYLDNERISYPENHIECDNRLTWFLPRLTDKYGKNSILVKVTRDKKKISKSLNQRWAGIRIMKAYSQGILMRPLNENTIEVCEDYVNNVYEHIDYFSEKWCYFIDIDLANPEEGIKKLFDILKVSSSDDALKYFKENSLNMNKVNIYQKFYHLKYNIEVLISDLINS